jgi:hypothetical protein
LTRRSDRFGVSAIAAGTIQLGHEDSTITREVYAHVYDRAKKAQAVREAFSR